ncbi:MAG: hypothetical protein ABW122_05760, partial [Ilumatobacteraceae bacterium]
MDEGTERADPGPPIREIDVPTESAVAVVEAPVPVDDDLAEAVDEPALEALAPAAGRPDGHRPTWERAGRRVVRRPLRWA